MYLVYYNNSLVCASSVVYEQSNNELFETWMLWTIAQYTVFALN